MKNYKNHTDEALMTLIQKGKEAAFNELYARYSNRLLYFMYRMLGQDEVKAQDFLQDLFLKIVNDPSKFDTSKNFKTWIFTVAANQCKNAYRQQNKTTVDLDQIGELSASGNLDSIDNAAFKQELAERLNELHPVYKEAFILRYYEGLSLNEIAEVANCPLGTVKSRLHSATRALSKKLIHYQH
ncbi:MAG: RNA polymerase sigma-70 factor (ECF subfamily) [Crocinitomix sp.]|jgi:RNA polymerase sigma-70 factor (ECF subfamily)